MSIYPIALAFRIGDATSRAAATTRTSHEVSRACRTASPEVRGVWHAQYYDVFFVLRVYCK